MRGMLVDEVIDRCRYRRRLTAFDPFRPAKLGRLRTVRIRYYNSSLLPIRKDVLSVTGNLKNLIVGCNSGKTRTTCLRRRSCCQHQSFNLFDTLLACWRSLIAPTEFAFGP